MDYNMKILLQHKTKENINQKTTLLTLTKKKLNKMPNTDFFFLTPDSTYFRVLIRGEHIRKGRIHRFDAKYNKLYSSINKAFQEIDKDLPTDNLDLLTYGVIIKKDNKILFQFPVNVSITDPSIKNLKLGNSFDNYKDRLKNDDKIKEMLKNKSVNGKDNVTVYEYNTYVISTILSSNMELKDENKIVIDEEVKAQFIVSYIEDTLFNKDPILENVNIEKNLKYMSIPNIFEGWIDLFEDKEYMIFPNNVNFNNLKIIVLDERELE